MNTSLALRLINARPVVRRLAAVGVTLTGVGIVTFVGSWALMSLLDSRAELTERRTLAGRLQAVASLRFTMEEALKTEGNLDESASANFLVGESEAVMRGNLQAKISAVATGSAVNLISTRNLPDLELDGTRYAGMSADLSGPITAVHAAVLAIESSPELLIRDAAFWASNVPVGSNAAQVPEIAGQLQIFGAVRPEFDKPVAAKP